MSSEKPRISIIGLIRTLAIAVALFAFPATAWNDLVRWNQKWLAVSVEVFLVMCIIVSIFAMLNINPFRDWKKK